MITEEIGSEGVSNSMTLEQTDLLKHGILFYLVRDKLPFNIVETEGFQEMSRILKPDFTVTNTETMICLMTRKCEDIRTKIGSDEW